MEWRYESRNACRALSFSMNKLFRRWSYFERRQHVTVTVSDEDYTILSTSIDRRSDE
jgi:hypothetical protein